MVSAMAVPGMVTVCSPMALNMSSMMRPARSPLDLAQSFTSSITQKDLSLPADTEMFNLAGDYGNAFFESFHDNNVFSQYLFNYWQYTDYYGTWPGQPIANVPKSLYDKKVQSDWTQKWFEFGTLNLPNAAYANAVHKNGAKSIAMIFYSDNDRGEQTYKDLLEGKRADGTYLVADKLVEIAEYYGFDGYFVNQESDVSADDVLAYQDFMKQIVDQGIYIQWYDSATYPGGGVGYQDMFNGSNSPYVQDTDKGKISDSIFLNYWFSGNMLKDSAAHAESFGIDPKYAVFAGIESGQKKFDSIGSNAGYMNVNLDDTGKPYVSLAALGTDFVSRELGDDKKVYPKYQNQVFDRERRLWTGSSTGEKGTTDIADNYIDDGTSNDGWKGFASQIAECSVVGGSMFSTSFNTGHGLEWRDGGEQTSDQQWGNINLQDILPTWQWWIDADSDRLQGRVRLRRLRRTDRQVGSRRLRHHQELPALLGQHLPRRPLRRHPVCQAPARQDRHAQALRRGRGRLAFARHRSAAERSGGRLRRESRTRQGRQRQGLLDQSAGIRRENRDRQIRHRFVALRREAVFPDRQGRRRQEQSDDCQCAG